MDKNMELQVYASAKKMKNNRRRRTVAAFCCTCIFLVGITVCGNFLMEAAPATDFSNKNLAPSLQHLFGTDWMGRDMMTRTVAGLSLSIRLGLLAAGFSAVMAAVLGTMAATMGERVDFVITWVIDLMLGMPHIVLLLLISFAIGKGFWGVTVGVALTHWPGLARVVRGEVLQVREATYVKVASKLGQSTAKIAWKHIFPHVFPQFLIGTILLFPHAILHEASVTFLGFGLPPEQPAIGIILSESMAYLSAGRWWLALFPGLALILTVALFDMAGENLRKLLAPSSAQD